MVLGAGFYPLAMLASEAAARRVDGRLEEAALLVASRWRVLRRITRTSTADEWRQNNAVGEIMFD